MRATSRRPHVLGPSRSRMRATFIAREGDVEKAPPSPPSPPPPPSHSLTHGGREGGGVGRPRVFVAIPWPTLVQAGNGIELDTVGRRFEPYRWRACGVTWDLVPNSRGYSCGEPPPFS